MSTTPLADEPSISGLSRPALAARARSVVALGLTSLLCFLVLAVVPFGAQAQSALLHVNGMTFVASRADDNEMVLHAARARFETEEAVVFLDEVHMVVEPSDFSGNFEIFCDEGQLDMETNDFEATGNVRGTTDGGRNFSAPWVQYDHEQGLLFTNAPVLIKEDAITYRGGGFQYYVRSKRFRLLGGASVVQEP